MSSETENKPSPKGGNKLLVAVMAVVILLLAAVVIYFVIYFNSVKDKDQLKTDPNIVLNEDDAARVAEQNKKKQDAIGVSMLREVTFADGTSQGTISLENPERNTYPFKVTISLLEGGTVLYESGLIPVGSGIETFTLSQDLDAGDYECVTTFTTYDEATGEPVGQVALMLTLHVLA